MSADVPPLEMRCDGDHEQSLAWYEHTYGDDGVTPGQWNKCGTCGGWWFTSFKEMFRAPPEQKPRRRHAFCADGKIRMPPERGKDS